MNAIKCTEVSCPIRVRNGIVLGLAGLLMTASPVLAQGSTNPGTAPANDPQMRSPFWGEDPYMRDRRISDGRRDYDDDDDDYYDRNTFAESFPVDLASLVAPARARYVALKWTHMTAQRQMSFRVRELRHALEDTEEYRNLQRDRDSAAKALEEARRNAMAPLLDDPKYQALVDLEAQLQGKITEKHRSGQRDLAEIQAMAEMAMRYSQQRREMEAGLVQNDMAISSAQSRVREIGELVRAMEDDFDRHLRSDEQLAMLRTQVLELRNEYLAAAGYYDSVVRSADVGLRFAYFNALTQAGYFTPYYPYTYGGGFGHGFHNGFNGGFVIGGVTTGDSGTGPIRLRPTLFPTPILSNTFRGVNQVPIPFIPTGNEAPGIPVPEAPPPE